MYYLTLDNALYFAPIPKEQKLHRVLDLGTGTGAWAIDFGMHTQSKESKTQCTNRPISADEHPESLVRQHIKPNQSIKI